MNMHRVFSPWTALLFAALLLMSAPRHLIAGGQGAEPVREAINVSALGPQVGAQIPDFGLPDQTGRIRDRQSIMGPSGAMVVFFRSADW